MLHHFEPPFGRVLQRLGESRRAANDQHFSNFTHPLIPAGSQFCPQVREPLLAAHLKCVLKLNAAGAQGKVLSFDAVHDLGEVRAVNQLWGDPSADASREVIGAGENGIGFTNQGTAHAVEPADASSTAEV